MAKSKPISGLVNIAAWVTGILVSLAVGFGMVDGVLNVRFIPAVVTVIAGWLVVILTIISVILAIANKL
ncbi:MAG: hypothetical protein Q8N63_00745 [Nanoarchaeota archaeon]|nr:hypothetical protein [Nanoarchaeota archaeon]